MGAVAEDTRLRQKGGVVYVIIAHAVRWLLTLKLGTQLANQIGK